MKCFQGMASGSTIPVIIGENKESPNDGPKHSESTSRTLFASSRDYVTYVKKANEIGELRRKSLKPKQLIPKQFKHLFSRSHADGPSLDKYELLVAVQRHEGFIQGGNVPNDQVANGVRQATEI